ncbi:hypothetical protein GCM10009613_50850 [Pseudonocardia kongjuensis]|uniref:Uncharacterized protein n=1 Tax=Pseudonocardia kongjuensis TaxID=102227 RepID=A0ABP4ISC2_9PSEU
MSETPDAYDGTAGAPAAVEVTAMFSSAVLVTTPGAAQFGAVRRPEAAVTSCPRNRAAANTRLPT